MCYNYRRRRQAVSAVLLALAQLLIYCRLAEGQSGRVWLTPPALNPGATIMIVAPGSPPNRAQVEAAADQFRRMGYRVLVPRDLYRQNDASDYLAGSDDQRAAELNRAIHDPRVSAIFAARGRARC